MGWPFPQIENRKSKIQNGFTLIEAAVAIAIVAILAGAVAPLAVKALNQQREFKTREGLKACFEACFGSRERRVANMRADFGFDPTASLTGLAVMVSRPGTSWSAVPTYGYNSSSKFPWGWNGPYWNGSLDSNNNPLDAWGKPFQLTVASGTFQVVSGGPDGNVATTGDNLVHPNIAPSYLAYNATVNLVITKASANIAGNAVVSFPYGATGTGTLHMSSSVGSITFTPASPAVGALAVTTTATFPIANSTQTLSFNLPSGGCQITFTATDTPSLYGFTLSLDLLPGETRNVDLSL